MGGAERVVRVECKKLEIGHPNHCEKPRRPERSAQMLEKKKKVERERRTVHSSALRGADSGSGVFQYETKGAGLALGL